MRKKRKKLFPIPSDVIDLIKMIPPEDLCRRGVIAEAKKKVNNETSYVCPECENGTGEDGTGIVPTMIEDVYTYHCFKCDASFDNIRLFALHYGLDERRDFRTICDWVCKEFNIIDYSGPGISSKAMQKAELKAITKAARKSREKMKESQKKKEKELTPEEKELNLINKDIVEAYENLKKQASTVEIDHKDERFRQLTNYTLLKFGCGVLETWTPPKCRVTGKYVPPTARLIIPYGEDHYFARRIEALSFANDCIPKQYKWKVIEKQHVGKKSTFNYGAISTTKLNIIVEGEIDAMSIWQATKEEISPIATGGSSNFSDLLEKLKRDYGKETEKPR